MYGLIDILSKSCLSGKLITSEQDFIIDLLKEKYASTVESDQFDSDVNMVIVKELMN